MKRILASLGIGAVVLGGITLNPDQSFRMEAQASVGGQFDFGPVPTYTVDVSESGVIAIATEGKAFTMEPESAGETGSKNGKSILIDAKQEGENIKMDRVWGLGSTVEVIATDKKLTKQVKLEEGFVGTLSKDGEYYEISFALGGDFIVADGEYTGRVEIAPNVWLEKGLAWDSSLGDEMNDIPNQNYTDVSFTVSNGVLTKRIPVSWLKSAIFPIYTDATFTFGAKQTADSRSIGYGNVAKVGDNKFVTCFTDVTDSAQEGYCVVATTSTTSMTYGSTSVAFNADVFGGTTQGGPTVCSVGDDRFVLAYFRDGINDEQILFATTTGLVINGYSPGVTLPFADSHLYIECEQIDSDRIVVTSFVNANVDLILSVCNLSATSVSCGSPSTIIEKNNGSNRFRNNDCGALGSNSFVCRTNDASSSTVLVYAGSVTGTSTVTTGALATVTPQSVAENGINGRLLTFGTEHFVVYHNGTTTSQFFSLLNVGSVSGNTVTLGASSTIIATSSANMSMLKIDEDSFALFGQIGATDAVDTYLGIIYCDVNTSTLTINCQPPEEYDSSTDIGSFVSGIGLSSTKIVLGWEDDNSSNDLFEIIGDLIDAFTPHTYINGNAYINGNLYISH